MAEKQRRFRIDRANVVGVADTPRGLGRVRATPLDVVEVRADAFDRLPSVERLRALGRPVLLTVRCAEEGGVRALDQQAREAIFRKLLPAAAAVDIELRSLRSLRTVAEEARSAGCMVVVSLHDFSGTPPAGRLAAAGRRAREAGADVVKIATRTDSPADVARLLRLFDAADGPLAVMGMGRLGRASRLLFAGCGSVLNYGYLDRPNVPGQWSARQLHDLLAG